MELTQEQLDGIINDVVEKTKVKTIDTVKDIVSEIMKDVVTKDNFTELTKVLATKQDLDDLKNAVATSEAKTNEAVKKIATETDTKIQQLRTTPAENKAWYNRELI